VTALDRTFGFELEVADGAGELALALYNQQLTVSSRRHEWHCRCQACAPTFGQWGNWLKVQFDSSCGGEVISSVLRWGDIGNIDDGESNVNPNLIIEKLTQTLVDNDTPIDDRCGLHVHVGATDLSNSQLGRLYSLMHHHEAILYRLACGRSATHRGYANEFNYCRPMSAFNNPVELKELALLKSAQVKSSPIAHNKYVAANLMPIESLGTVEFRLWESTRSLRRLRLYSKLSVALVQRARRRRNPVGPALDLGEQADDSVFGMFLDDLRDVVPELVDGQFMADAWWQWNEGPARWQERIVLPPLPHHTIEGGLATTAEDPIVEQYDSHGRQVTVPPEYDLSRTERERLVRERSREFYRTRIIPEHLRAADESDPNYDCGNSRCVGGPCQENRTSFWTGVETNNVRTPRRQVRDRVRFESPPLASDEELAEYSVEHVPARRRPGRQPRLRVTPEAEAPPERHSWQASAGEASLDWGVALDTEVAQELLLDSAPLYTFTDEEDQV
jgi:hypothetical protein